MATNPGALAGAAQQPDGKAIDPRSVELANLLVARVREALAKVPRELDTALKADPVQGAVQIGTQALRGVVQAAQDAGKTPPFEVIVAAGMQTIKDMAEIAVEKGYLPEDGIETFLKEAFQQSLTAYAKLDTQDGLISPDQLSAIGQQGSAAQAPQEGMS